MRRRWRTVGLLLLVPGLVLGSARGAGAIAHGTWVSKPTVSAPWVLPLLYSTNGYFRWRVVCTGIAIDPETIVTAASCVQRTGFYEATLDGRPLHNNDGVPRGTTAAVRVEAVLAHPGFRSTTLLNDIAVLRPLHPLTLTSYAQLAPASVSALLTSPTPPALTLYGWGQSERSAAGRLRQGVVQLQPRAAARAWRSRFRPKTMLAVGRARAQGAGYVRACTGDTGGPLVVRKRGVSYVVGVTSWSASSCRAARPTLLTSVAAYRGWLRQASASLPQAASDDNRAKPEQITATAIEGTVSVGSVLTCRAGTWTSNTIRLDITWQTRRPLTGEEVTTKGSTWTLSSVDAGARLTCTVDAYSAVGRASASALAVASIPSGPSRASNTLSVMSLTAGAPTPLPSPGTPVTCTPPTYRQTGVPVTVTWSVVSGGIATEIGTGSPLTLTAAVLRQLAGRTLRCTTTASWGGFAPDVLTVDRAMAALAPPVVTRVSIIPDLTFVAPTTGMTVMCSASVAGPVENVGYSWAMQTADPAANPPGDTTLDPSARILGTDQNYVLTAADVAAFSTEYLVCTATASTWQGSDSRWDWF